MHLIVQISISVKCEKQNIFWGSRLFDMHHHNKHDTEQIKWNLEYLSWLLLTSNDSLRLEKICDWLMTYLAIDRKMGH